MILCTEAVSLVLSWLIGLFKMVMYHTETKQYYWVENFWIKEL